MNKYTTNFFKYTVLISLAIYLFDQGSSWISGSTIGSFTEEIKKFVIYFLYSFIIGGANIYLISFLDKRISWRTETKKRLIVGLIGSVVVSIFAIALVRLILTLAQGQDLEYFMVHQKAIYYFYSIVITLVVVLFFHAFYFYKALTEKKVSETEFVAKTETAKYESLKSQIDPHFLFNSLNVLTSLIGENPQQAEKFTTKLSKIYRYVLEQKDKNLVELDEELQFAKTYMELLKMRFENAVIFQIPDKASNPELKIVPLSLQLLLENTIKHNVVSEENPLEVIITEDNGYLTISNNYKPKTVLEKGTKVGLKNIVDRYRLITLKKVTIEKTDTKFMVKIPLLTQKIKKMNTQNTEQNTKYLRAVERVEELKGFYSSLIAYCIVIPLLIYINIRFTPDFYWFWFPMAGWGIGLVFQGFKAFSYNPFLGKDWEERKIQEYMNNDKKQYWE